MNKKYIIISCESKVLDFALRDLENQINFRAGEYKCTGDIRTMFIHDTYYVIQKMLLNESFWK